MIAVSSSSRSSSVGGNNETRPGARGSMRAGGCRAASLRSVDACSNLPLRTGADRLLLAALGGAVVVDRKHFYASQNSSSKH